MHKYRDKALCGLFFAAILVLNPGPIRCCAAGTPKIKASTPAEELISTKAIGWEPIDLATNLPAMTNHNVSGHFLRELLSSDARQINHCGLDLKNAIINRLDLENLDIPFEVRFECCHFQGDVNLSGAHFLHNLSFQSCVFDGKFTANALQVGGSLLFNAEEATILWTNRNWIPFDATSVIEALRTNAPKPWQWLAHSALNVQTNRQIMRWLVTDTNTKKWENSPTNYFEATLAGTNFFVLPANHARAEEQFSNTTRIGPAVAAQGVRSSVGPANLETVRGALGNMAGEKLDFIPSDHSMLDAPGLPTAFRWEYEDQDDSNRVIVARWDMGDEDVTYRRPVIFRHEVWLNGAVIGGKLEAVGVEFVNLVDLAGLKVGGDVFMPGARFDFGASFSNIRTGHDLVLMKALFAGAGAGFDAYGTTVDGSLIIEGARFGAIGTFEEVAVAKAFRGAGLCFENNRQLANFLGLKVGGSADFGNARFGGPVNFILARVSGNFDFDDAGFEDGQSLKDLKTISGYVSTFNADFGSIQVDGFAFFERARFCRSVSFRNARFANLNFDGVQWPEKNFMAFHLIDEPFPTNLLRVESMDFQTIRDIGDKSFSHSRPQLELSEARLMKMFRELSPYSFDVYSKLEDYFRREGEPHLADLVFIEAKKREGEEAGFVAKAGNWFLRWTVLYGRSPMRAFIESCVVIGFWAWLYRRYMIDRISGGKPGFFTVLLYSLDRFLPLVDLKAEDTLKVRPENESFRFWIGVERIIGFVLVPLWTISLAGFIK